MILNPKETYYRNKNILYDSKNNAVIEFQQKTADTENLTGILVENMNTYIRCYPERVEILKQKENPIEINLFNL